MKICNCKEEIINKINNILEKYTDKIGAVWDKEYNSDLDDICCDLIDLKDFIKDN